MDLIFDDHLTDFLAVVLSRSPNYRSADPAAGCMITSLKVRDELSWHFDDNDSVVTLSLVDTKVGGVFEFVPDTRNLGDTEIDTSLQRVSPVTAGPARLTLIFSYDSQREQCFSGVIGQGVFGRPGPLHPSNVHGCRG